MYTVKRLSKLIIHTGDWSALASFPCVVFQGSNVLILQSAKQVAKDFAQPHIRNLKCLFGREIAGRRHSLRLAACMRISDRPQKLLWALSESWNAHCGSFVDFCHSHTLSHASWWCMYSYTLWPLAQRPLLSHISTLIKGALLRQHRLSNGWHGWFCQERRSTHRTRQVKIDVDTLNPAWTERQTSKVQFLISTDQSHPYPTHSMSHTPLPRSQHAWNSRF